MMKNGGSKGRATMWVSKSGKVKKKKERDRREKKGYHLLI
jgi:hypothetical protein